MSKQTEVFEHRAIVQSETLSDGSSVFNVILTSGGELVKFECLDLWHADQLALTMRAAIDGWSMGKAEIVHRF